MRFFCLTALVFFPWFSPSERLILSLGEKILLPMPSSQKVRVGDKSLLSIQSEQELLSLRGKKEGRTFLIAGQKHYEIFIFKREKKLQALKLDQVLKTCWGLDWSLSTDNNLQVTGRLNRLYDWVKLSKISQTHNILYEFKALPGEGLKEPLHHYFKSRFKHQTAPEIVWNKLPLAYVPQGSDLSYYQKQLQPFGLKPKEELLWFSKSPFIEIEIALVEKLSSSGFSLGGKANSDKPLFLFSSLIGLLNFLKKSGRGKTLHHSSITGQSGQELIIQSGGQIPFNSWNFKMEQKNTSWKSHGLHLKVIPKLGKKGRIELTVKARLSEPLAFSSMDKPPPLKTQSLENKVILEDGQILKLFQLKKESQGAQNQGQLGFLPAVPPSLLTGRNTYKMTQFIFIQAKIINKNQTKNSPSVGNQLRSFDAKL